MEEILLIFMFFASFMLIVLTRFFLKLQEIKLKSKSNSSEQVRIDIQNLMIENEDLKMRVLNLEEMSDDQKEKIDFEFEKQQVFRNKDDNFTY